MARIDGVRCDAVEDLGEVLVESGRVREAIELLEEFVIGQPYRERPIATLMRSYAAVWSTRGRDEGVRAVPRGAAGRHGFGAVGGVACAGGGAVDVARRTELGATVVADGDGDVPVHGYRGFDGAVGR